MCHDLNDPIPQLWWNVHSISNQPGITRASLKPPLWTSRAPLPWIWAELAAVRRAPPCCSRSLTQHPSDAAAPKPKTSGWTTPRGIINSIIGVYVSKVEMNYKRMFYKYIVRNIYIYIHISYHIICMYIYRRVFVHMSQNCWWTSHTYILYIIMYIMYVYIYIYICISSFSPNIYPPFPVIFWQLLPRILQRPLHSTPTTLLSFQFQVARDQRPLSFFHLLASSNNHREHQPGDKPIIK